MLLVSTSIFFFLQYTECGKENTSLLKAVSDHMHFNTKEEEKNQLLLQLKITGAGFKQG